MSDPTMVEVALRIQAHLDRMQADPGINAPRPGSIAPYFNPSAKVVGRRIHVRYDSRFHAQEMTKAGALRYLSWLDSGGLGRYGEDGRLFHADKQELTLDQIASQIRAHLGRFEKSRTHNPQNDGATMVPYYGAGAWVDRDKIHVMFVRYLVSVALTREAAEKYLAWLDAGNVGQIDNNGDYTKNARVWVPKKPDAV